MGQGDVDLSEMYVVRSIYNDKAMNYMLRQGKANFSQGSLSHDLMRIVSVAGVMPEAVYDGMIDDAKGHDHSEMEAGLKGYLDGVRKQIRLSPYWQTAFGGIMDAYMGAAPDRFTVNGKSYDPYSYAQALGINPRDYLSITSFTHHPFGESFILEIPDNYSNGSYYNMPLNDLVATIDKALDDGYTVAWDGDVSEDGFSSKHGVAVLPIDFDKEKTFEAPADEEIVTQESRQAAFMDYRTTDDHLMHIIGKAKDQNGTPYYIIKNSWGERGPYDGLLYMSLPYLKAKTVGVMVHRDVVKM
jgi:bleomycin hydrolase